MSGKATKPCLACGRLMEWRRKWARDWDQVTYCSDACRAGKGRRAIDQNLEQAILTLLSQRKRGATICPSEAARLVSPEDWRSHTEAARQAARRLVGRGAIEITQGGRVVDASAARGAIRLRLRSS